jgi:long-chain acyl-CoA synthetase
MASQHTAQLYPRTTKKPPFSVEAPGHEPVKGETIPRRHPSSKDKLPTRPAEDVGTIWDNLKRAAEKFGNAKAIGTRKLLKTHHEIKKIKKIVNGQETQVDKKWTYFELSEYTYMSFIEYEKLVLQCGSGLANLGLVRHDKMHLFGATRSVL